MSGAEWQQQSVPLHFRSGELTWFSVPIKCMVLNSVFPAYGVCRAPQVPDADLPAGVEGYLLRSMPVPTKLPRFRSEENMLRYIPSQYERYYVDLDLSVDEYLARFSSKSRSGLRRKLRKLAEATGGQIQWRTYRSADELKTFHSLARHVSSKTYQERRLNAGLPESDQFLEHMYDLARRDQVRAYLLFDGEIPVAYLYTPAKDDILLYRYLGYDPAYSKLSPGTVLQWLALEQLFAEGRFKTFDFTAGEGQHKKFFATGSQFCADVFYLRSTLRNRSILFSHIVLDQASGTMVSSLDRLGIKARAKRYMRNSLI